MRLARVFPRKTSASPDDELAFFGPPDLYVNNVDKIHISVTWSYDIQKAESLAKAWRHIAPVELGGPAMGDPGGNFEPGKYLKYGYTITSRGCPNNCWFCDVPKREGRIMRELPIKPGNNILDNNLLACSINHITKVFHMLNGQRNVQLTGGLEAAKLTDQIIGMLWNLRPSQMFFAYDTPDDLEPLIIAGRKLRQADFTRKHCRCYVLIGYPKDTFVCAEKRLIQTWDAGFMPMGMLWKNLKGDEDVEWRRFQRIWSRPAITKNVIKKYHLDKWDKSK